MSKTYWVGLAICVVAITVSVIFKIGNTATIDGWCAYWGGVGSGVMFVGLVQTTK